MSSPLLLRLTLGLCLLTGCAGARIRAARDEVQIIQDIHYLAGATDDAHRLDLYLPRGREHFPLVLFVHGGFWRNQGRRYHQGLLGLYGNIGVALARRGIGVAVQSYRLAPGVGIAEQLADVAAAARWLAEHGAAYGGDTRGLVLMGYSAGGHLVTLLTLDQNLPQRAGLAPIRGVVSLSGILDVEAMAAQQDLCFNRQVTWPLFGRDAAGQRRYSPMGHLRADAPPLLLLAAEHDYPFVRQAGREAAARQAALGARASYREVPGIGHAGMVLRINSSTDQVSDTVAAFIREAAQSR